MVYTVCKCVCARACVCEWGTQGVSPQWDVLSEPVQLLPTHPSPLTLGWRARLSVVLELCLLRAPFPGLPQFSFTFPTHLCLLLSPAFWPGCFKAGGALLIQSSAFSLLWRMKNKRNKEKPQTHFVSEALLNIQLGCEQPRTYYSDL